jgi:hypothetical protein
LEINGTNVYYKLSFQIFQLRGLDALYSTKNYRMQSDSKGFNCILLSSHFHPDIAQKQKSITIRKWTQSEI